MTLSKSKWLAIKDVRAMSENIPGVKQTQLTRIRYAFLLGFKDTAQILYNCWCMDQDKDEP